MTRLFLLTLVLILYASLFPWQFRATPAAIDPLSLVLRSWTLHRPLFSVLGDVAVNIVAYVPLGLFAYLTFRGSSSPTAAALCATLAGFGLSFLVEITQSFVPGRNPNGLDVTSNTIGAAAGAVLAFFWSRLPHRHARRPDAMCLIAAWLATAVLPFVAPWSGPGIALAWRPDDMLQDYAATLALAVLVNTLGFSPMHRRVVLGLLVLMVPLRAAVASQSVTSGTLVAIALAYATALIVRLRPAPVCILLAAAITIHGLAPFKFLASPQRFSWKPFASTLASDSESGVIVLLGKVYLYGSLVWLLRESRVRLSIAALTVAGLLAAIEVIQVWLPRRTPEITDALLALIMAWFLWPLQPKTPVKPARCGL